jgi:transcriptional regulator with XRE-family HTH domain
MNDQNLGHTKRSQTDADSAMPNVGKRLRALRDQKGLSLRALADRSGLSVNAISLIERGVNSPTVASLQLLAMALDFPITEFFRETTDQITIFVRREQRVRYLHGGMDIESLGAGLRDQQLEPFLVSLKPGESAHDPEPITHAGQEFVYCVEGQIVYEIGEETFHLEAGDALLFEASQPHRFRNSTSTDAIILLVFSARDGNRTGRQQHLGT